MSLFSTLRSWLRRKSHAPRTDPVEIARVRERQEDLARRIRYLEFRQDSMREHRPERGQEAG